MSKTEIEETSVFSPRFDRDGLIACIAIDAASHDVLMAAHMNAEALRLTLETGIVHYWSRSRQTLWRKGDTSGQIQTLVELRVDCDQDALAAYVRVGGDGGACHTGRRSCFYRRVDLVNGEPRLTFAEDEPRTSRGGAGGASPRAESPKT